MANRNWDALLSGLADGPRENGTPELDEAAAFILRWLEAAGLRAQIQEFEAYPFEVIGLGVAIFLLSIGYFWASRAGRAGVAWMIACFLIGVPIAQLDWQVRPTRAWSVPEKNLLVHLPAREAKQRLVLSAHYDSKTEIVDHVVRAPIAIFGGALGIVLLLLPIAVFVAPRIRRRLVPLTAWTTLAYGGVALFVFGGGALLEDRSHGALDDGAACAVLMSTAAELSRRGPLQNTEVVVALFAAEEIGLQGAWHFVDEYLPSLETLPTAAVNFDPVGASQALTVPLREGALFRWHESQPDLIELVDAAHRDLTGKAIGRTRGGGMTDALPFLARGIPAATVISAVGPLLIPRGMHSAADTRSRIDIAALDVTADFVLALVDRFDRRKILQARRP
jgi:hypothetical protein